MQFSGFWLCVAIMFTFGATAQVSISTEDVAPHPSAILDVSSDSKGFLAPRMTSAQRDGIENPAPGLFVYNTDCGSLSFFDGNGWENFPPRKAEVTVSAQPAGGVLQGTSVTFTANTTNGGASPTFVWRRNGVQVGTGSTYSSSSLMDGDLLICEMTSSLPCVTGSPASAPEYHMTVYPNLQIGDLYQGGFIFHLTSVSPPHGLICAPFDLKGSDPWNSPTWGCEWEEVGGTSLEVGTGAANTAIINANCSGWPETAAQTTNDLMIGNYSDWYLPSRDELVLLISNLYNTTYPSMFDSGSGGYYWSSSEDGQDNAWSVDPWGYTYSDYKGNSNNMVRAIRTF